MTPKLQAQASECGLVSLSMIASHHGLNLDMTELRARFPLSLKGATLETLISHASLLRLSARPLRLELDELAELQIPCILHWNMNHFVVLEKVTKSGVVILDPAVGRRTLSLASVSKEFTGVALELSPTVTFEKVAQTPRMSIAQLTGRISGLWRSLGQIFALALVLELFALAAPLLNQIVLDSVIDSGDKDLLDIVILGFALLLIIQTAVALARSWMVMILGQTVGLQWVSNVFSHMLKLPADFFEKRHLGDITSRFSAIGSIQRTLTTSVIEAMLDGLMCIAAFFMMIVYSPLLTIPAVIATVLYGVTRAVSYQPYRNASAERMVLAARESTHLAVSRIKRNTGLINSVSCMLEQCYMPSINDQWRVSI